MKFSLLVVSIVALFAACSSIPLSSKAQSEVAAHGSLLAKCQSEGKATAADAGGDAGLHAYADCKKDGGL